MNYDDRRTAIGFNVALSGRLMTAALGVLALEGGFLVFVLGNRIVGWMFYVFTFLAFITFVISIYLGGKGIEATGSAGFDGYWTFSAGKRYFSRQAKFCILGLIFLVLMAVFSGTPKQDSDLEQISKINRNFEALNGMVKSISLSNESLSKELQLISNNVDKVAKELKDLKNKIGDKQTIRKSE